MKSKIFLVILLTVFFCSCHHAGDNLSLNTVDSHDTFRFEAIYPDDKTGRLEQYLDKEFNNDLPLDENIDLMVNLNGTDRFNLKAKQGWLEITLDKGNNSISSYHKLKRITQGMGKVLTEK